MNLNLILILLIKVYICSRITTEIPAGGSECYYKDISQTQQKISIYFGVNEGGDFLINLTVNDPLKQSIIVEEYKRQGEYVFIANKPGEYAFCFSNISAEPKKVDFDVQVKGEKDIYSPLKFKDVDHLDRMDRVLFTIQEITFEVLRDQNIFRTRGARNDEIIKKLTNTLHSHQFTFCIIIVVVALIQALAIRSFFRKR